MYNIRKCPPQVLEYGSDTSNDNASNVSFVYGDVSQSWWVKYCGNFSNDTGMNVSSHVKLFPPVPLNAELMLGKAGEPVPSLNDVANRTDEVVANITAMCDAYVASDLAQQVLNVLANCSNLTSGSAAWNDTNCTGNISNGTLLEALGGLGLNVSNGTNLSNLTQTVQAMLPSDHQLFDTAVDEVEDLGPKTCWDYEPAFGSLSFDQTTNTSSSDDMVIKIKSVDSCIKPCWKNPVVRGFGACNSTPSYDFALR
jgi:hypothetical protein